jgi:hypothetical protein
MNFAESNKQKRDIESNIEETLKDMMSLGNESWRVADVAHNSKKILADLDDEFETQTGLNKTDVSFVFFATALQCVRQYLLTDFKERLDDQTAAKETPGHKKEHSDRSHQWYKPSLNEVITNPVPFDAIYGSKDFNLGLSGMSHRQKTLGHDPLLGWVFGTSNIATSTITTWDFNSYHVKTGFLTNSAMRDKITNKADTGKVLWHTKEKLMNNGSDRLIVAASLAKECIHLRSDIMTKKSLPLPMVSSISPAFADELSKYGLDMANTLTVVKQASFAAMINAVIGMIHYMFFDPFKDNSRKLYEVRTRKILTYSNLLASASNVIFVAINTATGNKTSIQKLDIGGFIVTIHRLISDQMFIQKVKEEFVFENFNKKIRGLL